MEERQQLRILVDTNVWLDRFVPQRPGAAHARRLFARCSRDDILLMYPPHTMQDVFYLVARDAEAWIRSQKGLLSDEAAAAANSQAWECACSMSEMATMVSMGQGDLWVALKYRELHNDLEDDLVIAVAQRVGADYLVTSDKQLIAKSLVPALTPEDMLVVLAARG